jgi:hypothetical protein
MVHVPEVSSDTVVPDTVQTGSVREVNVTGKLDDAVAYNVTMVPADCVPTGPINVMVCGLKLTVKLCETGVAAA